MAGYLGAGGIGFLLAPQIMLKVFFSNGDYSGLMLRMLGTLLLALSVVILQIIRHNVSILYPTTLIVRSVILAAFAALYVAYRDPMLLVLIGIVGLGFIFTATSYRRDRRLATDRADTVST